MLLFNRLQQLGRTQRSVGLQFQQLVFPNSSKTIARKFYRTVSGLLERLRTG
jgi:hypothetical protein